MLPGTAATVLGRLAATGSVPRTAAAELAAELAAERMACSWGEMGTWAPDPEREYNKKRALVLGLSGTGGIYHEVEDMMWGLDGGYKGLWLNRHGIGYGRGRDGTSGESISIEHSELFGRDFGTELGGGGG